MSSDEEDYMSASFVQDSSPAGDIRPGLLFNRNQQRSHAMQKRKEETDATNKLKFRPQKVVEAERREEGLQEPLGSNNKGFAMLQKMGYKPGSGIGKSGEGRIEPVPVQLKSDRHGLGRTAALEEVRERKRSLRAKRQQRSQEAEVTPEQFRARLAQKSAQRLIEIDLYKSQKTCYQLDTEGGYMEPAELWFWPASACKTDQPNPKGESEDSEGPADVDSLSGNSCNKSEDKCDESEVEDDDDEFDPLEKLEMLTKYLRSTYNYCVWCCVKYDDEKDMQEECPGSTRDDH